MAIRWVDKGMGTEHGMVGGTRMFTLLHPIVEDGGAWTLSSDLPGPAAGALVVKKHDSAQAAKRRAHRFLTDWLYRYQAWLQEPPAEVDGPTYWDQGPRPGVQLREAEVIVNRCAGVNPLGNGDRCELTAGHLSLHAYGDRSWGDPCGAVGGDLSELTCVLYEGHSTRHMSTDAGEWVS